MDASRYNRRSTQTLRQNKQSSTGGYIDFRTPRSDYRRPITSAPNLAPRLRAAPPALQPIARPVSEPPIPPVATTQPAAQPVFEQPAPVAVPRTTPPIDMSLPGDSSRADSVRRFVAGGPWYAVRKWALRGGITALVLVIAVGGLLFSQGAFKARKVFSGASPSAASLKTAVDPNLLKGEGDGRINVLLLGRGGGTHAAPDLTDTMILASIDPVNKTQSLVSIPRDLWVKVPNAGSMKINAAWETGEFKYLGKIAPGSTDPKAVQAGFDMVDQTVESVLGVPINYNLIVNFQAFQQTVSTVGGVDITVPTDLIDPTMAWQNDNNPVIAKAGQQTFDGAHALNYVRSRETTSDFARSERQRAVMLAIKTKVKSLGILSNPLKISQLINDFGNNVSTDLSLTDAQRLYSIISGIDDSTTASIGLADEPNKFVTTGNIGGQSVVLPKAGLHDYSDIQRYIRTQLKDGYIVKENAKVAVYNGTTLPGVATGYSDMLKSYGYNVTSSVNTPNTGWTQTVLVDLSGGADKYTKNYLEQRLKVKAVTRMPDDTITANGADFVIIVGSDEATTTPN